MPPIIYDEHKWESTQNTHVNNYKAGQDLPFRAFVKHSLTDKNTIVEATNVPEAIGYVISPLGIKAGERGDVLYGEHRPHGSDEAGLGVGDGGVEQYANQAAFPATGVDNVLYVAQDTNKTYVWDTGGMTYVETPQSIGNFGDLNDTTFTSLNDQDIAMYDQGSGQWINVPLASVVTTCTPELIKPSRAFLASDFQTTTENQWISTGVFVVVQSEEGERAQINASVLLGHDYFAGKPVSFGVSVDGGDPVRAHQLKNMFDDPNRRNGDNMVFITEPLSAGQHKFEIKIFLSTSNAGTTTVYAQDLAAVPVIAGTRLEVYQHGACMDQSPLLVTENRLGTTLGSTGADWATGFITKFYTEGDENVLFYLNPSYSMGGAGGTPDLRLKVSIDGGGPTFISRPTEGNAANSRNNESIILPWRVTGAGEHTIEIVLDSADAGRPKTLYGFEGLASASGIPYSGSMVQVVQYAQNEGVEALDHSRSFMATDQVLTTDNNWETTTLTHTFSTTEVDEDVLVHFQLSILGEQTPEKQMTMGYTLNGGPIVPIRRDNHTASGPGRYVTNRGVVLLEDLAIQSHTIEFYVFVGQADNLTVAGSATNTYWATSIATMRFLDYDVPFDIDQLNFGEVFTGRTDVFGNKIFAKMYTGTLTDSTAAVQTDVIDNYPSGRAIVNVMGAIGSGDTPANAVDVYPVPYNNAGVETVLADYVVAQVRRNASGFIIEHQQIPANSQYRIIIEYTRA